MLYHSRRYRVTPDLSKHTRLSRLPQTTSTYSRPACSTHKVDKRRRYRDSSCTQVGLQQYLTYTFRIFLQVALDEDCKQLQVPGRLYAVLLFTFQVVLECLRNECKIYVLPIACNLATVISDSKVYNDIVCVLKSRFLETPHDCQSSNPRYTLSDGVVLFAIKFLSCALFLTFQTRCYV